MRGEYYATRRPQEELYDLRADPWEYRNLADDPQQRDTLADLLSRVQAWMEETDDPLLHGDVQPTPEQRQRIAEWGEDN